MIDILQNDAFKSAALTAAVNKIDFVPGRAGEVAFVGTGEGIATTTAQIEVSGETLSLVQSQVRGAPVQHINGNKRSVKSVAVPHIPLESTIRADEIQNVRDFGSENLISGATNVINQRLAKMTNMLDLTVENLRLGALKGRVLDADGSELVNLYSTFGVAEPAQTNFALGTATTEVRTKCSGVIRAMKKAAKMSLPSTARIHAFAGANFFDALLEHPSVKGVYDGYQMAERRLGASYVHGIFEFGGIFFEEYQGSDDGAVGIDSNEVRFFFADAPGVYAEYYAPGDFMEAVNTIGLPRYAKMAADDRFNRYVELHVQTNPLPICLRPATLLSGRKA